jgi:hypothetical protein
LEYVLKKFISTYRVQLEIDSSQHDQKANMPQTPDCFVCNLRHDGRTLYFLSIPTSLQRQK